MMPLTAQDKEKILSFLESRLEPKVYDTWCRSLDLDPAGENAYRVPTANPFYRDWLEKLLRKPLEDAFTNLFGRSPDLVFPVNAGPLPALSPVYAETASSKPAAAPLEPAPVIPDFVYNPNYTFENF